MDVYVLVEMRPYFEKPYVNGVYFSLLDAQKRLASLHHAEMREREWSYDDHEESFYESHNGVVGMVDLDPDWVYWTIQRRTVE